MTLGNQEAVTLRCEECGRETKDGTVLGAWHKMESHMRSTHGWNDEDFSGEGFIDLEWEDDTNGEA